MTPSIELRGVQKRFGDFVAVGGVSLLVQPGVLFGLLGPNGAGKTTTIRMMMDIIAPDAGEVFFFGRERRPEDLKRVGYLPEERGLYRKMTVVDQLVFLGELRGLKRRQSLPKIERWLERVELGAWGKRKVEELSKGMQQKVQLIGTVLHEPDILILDEPFSGLDPINQGLFKDLFFEYKQRGKTILFSTHVMEQAEKICDHIGLISQGRVILSGELKEIKRRLGGNSYRLVADSADGGGGDGLAGAMARLEGLPAVDQVVRRGEDGAVKLLLRPDAVGSEVLRQIVPFLAVKEFRSEEPDLEEIFIKAVRDAA
ncbi:MAG TPA: ATP-binding cassette domain-containing protein [Thermoanaerobaculia bacterium]|nr:ATP-binding cassette domain-containing protein [Thermoanaerobaculia bacterium]